MISNLFCLLLVTSLFTSDGLEKKEQCLYDVITHFKHFDRQLSHRHAQKINLIKTYTKYSDYLVHLENTVVSIGKKISGLGTRSWLSEVYQGVENDYKMLKNSKSFVKVDNLYKLFQTLNPDHFNIYLMQINGPLQFSWIIEQLPYQRGFRILQSAHDAYTLNAWLSEKFTSMLWWNKDLMYWEDNYARLNSMLKHIYGCNMADLNCLPRQADWMKPWLKHVSNYGRNEIESNFMRAWKKYGGYQVISPDIFYDEYLPTLQNLTDGINSLIGTNDKWTNELHTYWIKLFGTPNQYVYPGVPFVAMTKQKFSLEKSFIEAYSVKNVYYDEIPTNVRLLEKSLNLTDTKKQFCGNSSKLFYSYWLIIQLLIISIMVT